MFDYILSAQLFSIGFVFGISGPCLLSCMPVIFLYFSSRKDTFNKTIASILLLLLGRLISYCALGALAGFSAQIMRNFVDRSLFNYGGGIVIIILGGYLWFDNWGKENNKCLATKFNKNNLNQITFFILGVVIGLSPCPPLIALFFELVIISKTPFQGMTYALFFGLGTMSAGILILVPFSKFASWLPNKLIGRNLNLNNLYKRLCSLLLIALGFWMLKGH